MGVHLILLSRHNNTTSHNLFYIYKVRLKPMVNYTSISFAILSFNILPTGIWSHRLLAHRASGMQFEVNGHLNVRNWLRYFVNVLATNTVDRATACLKHKKIHTTSWWWQALIMGAYRMRFHLCQNFDTGPEWHLFFTSYEIAESVNWDSMTAFKWISTVMLLLIIR